MLDWAYPRLKKWHEWWLRDRGDGQSWRDGNHDGLLEWGSDRAPPEPADWVIEQCMDDPFPDYDSEPVMYANG